MLTCTFMRKPVLTIVQIISKVFTAKLSTVQSTAIILSYMFTTAEPSSFFHTRTTCCCSPSSQRASLIGKSPYNFVITWNVLQMTEGDITRTALLCKESCIQTYYMRDGSGCSPLFLETQARGVVRAMANRFVHACIVCHLFHGTQRVHTEPLGQLSL